MYVGGRLITQAFAPESTMNKKLGGETEGEISLERSVRNINTVGVVTLGEGSGGTVSTEMEGITEGGRIEAIGSPLLFLPFVLSTSTVFLCYSFVQSCNFESNFN